MLISFTPFLCIYLWILLYIQLSICYMSYVKVNFKTTNLKLSDCYNNAFHKSFNTNNSNEWLASNNFVNFFLFYKYYKQISQMVTYTELIIQFTHHYPMMQSLNSKPNSHWDPLPLIKRDLNSAHLNILHLCFAVGPMPLGYKFFHDLSKLPSHYFQQFLI